MAAFLRQLQQTGRLSVYATLSASILASCAFLAFRIREYNTIEYSFLVWNLILAIIPFIISQGLVLRPPRSATVLFVSMFFWLLFFPNAPYLATDLLHLSSRGAAPFWFDLVLFLSFAWNGLMLGYISLLDIHGVIERRLSSAAGWLFSGTALVLASFGIYLGRYLRWNSWDLFTQPASLLDDVSSRLFHPSDNLTLYGVTLAFFAFLMLGYLLLRSLMHLRGREPSW